MTIIREDKLTKIAENVKPDAKNRVCLSKILVREGVTYHVYTNSIGQIILDPQVTIPAAEVWLFEDKKALALVDKGMVESTSEQVVDRGSFAKYAKDAS